MLRRWSFFSRTHEPKTKELQFHWHHGDWDMSTSPLKPTNPGSKGIAGHWQQSLRCSSFSLLNTDSTRQYVILVLTGSRFDSIYHPFEKESKKSKPGNQTLAKRKTNSKCKKQQNYNTTCVFFWRLFSHFGEKTRKQVTTFSWKKPTPQAPTPGHPNTQPCCFYFPCVFFWCMLLFFNFRFPMSLSRVIYFYTCFFQSPLFFLFLFLAFDRMAFGMEERLIKLSGVHNVIHYAIHPKPGNHMNPLDRLNPFPLSGLYSCILPVQYQ